MMSQMLERQQIAEVRTRRKTPLPPSSAHFGGCSRPGRILRPRCYLQILIPSATESILREPPRFTRTAYQHRRTADPVR
jgi:hypothetical protein